MISVFRQSPKFLAFTILATSLVGLSVQTQAQSLEAFQGIWPGNGYSFGNYSGNWGPNNASNPFVSEAQFTGKDSHGIEQTMIVDGTAYSWASYGEVHAYGGGTVTNPYYNPLNPDWNGQSGSDSAGSPSYVGVHGNAGWSDTLKYSNLDAGVYVNFFFRLDGTTSGDVEAGLNFYTSDGSAGWFTPRVQGGGVTWVTPNYQIGGDGTLAINVDFYAGMTTYFANRPEGVTYSSYADYSNTLALTGMQVTDANGNIVNGWSVTSASGAVYPVPEPASLIVLGLGLACFARNRRK